MEKLVLFIKNKFFITTINVFVLFLLLKFSGLIIDRFINALVLKYDQDFEFKKQMYTINFIIKSVVNTLIVVFAIMYILNNLGIDIRPILTAAGVLGVAVGFGARRFFEDIITGFSLILEGQIRVGDYVEIVGHEGIIEKADIKLVQLRDLDGRVHYIRNGMIDIVTNYTREYSYASFDIGVSYKENIGRVIDVLKNISDDFCKNSDVKDFILSPMEILGLDKFDDSAVIIKARIKTKPVKQWDVGRAFNLILKEKFDELGIEIPFPQTTVHIEKE